MKRSFYSAMLLLAGICTACHHKNTEDILDGPTKDGTTLDLVRDSIYLYTKEAYCWADGIPSYHDFQPRAINGSTDLASVTAEVNLLSQFKINPATGQPYEYVANSGGQAKYSFIDNGQTSTALGGSKADFGFAITAISATDMRVRYVYAGSAAGNANLHRGDMITTVNGRTGIDLSTSSDYNFVVNAIGVSPLNLTLKRPDNSTYSVVLNAGAYTVNPVLLYKTFDYGAGKKVGYIVFNSFTSPDNATAKLDQAFASFTSAGITDLVVDLRYNGGGYVSTSEYLANLIVPAAKNNTLMYNYYFNSTLQSGKAQVLKNQVYRDQNGLYNGAQIDYSVAGNAVNFSKKGSLNVSRVYFLVTGNTASASELAINNLMPVMDVKLIGTNTYGKPVGFFAININAYQLYVPEFETKNSVGGGGYYTGMAPGTYAYQGYNTGGDDLIKDFGDPTEGMLSRALNYVQFGSFGTTLKIQSVDGQAAVSRNVGDAGVTDMVLDKKLKVKR